MGLKLSKQHVSGVTVDAWHTCHLYTEQLSQLWLLVCHYSPIEVYFTFLSQYLSYFGVWAHNLLLHANNFICHPYLKTTNIQTITITYQYKGKISVWDITKCENDRPFTYLIIMHCVARVIKEFMHYFVKPGSWWTCKILCTVMQTPRS